jgi:anti-sigma factor RsiW
MSGGRVVPLNPDAHAEVQVLLPWYVSGRLEADEHALVEAHLAACGRCAAEVEAERRLQAAHVGIETPGDVERSLAALRTRMAASRPAAQPAPAPIAGGPRGWPWRRVPGWLQGALALQFAVIVGLAGWLLATPEGDYRVLGSSAASGNVVVKFRADAAERDIRRALRASGARLVDGPTSTDAYLLAVPEGQEATAIARLRAEPHVLLAESLGGGGAR